MWFRTVKLWLVGALIGGILLPVTPAMAELTIAPLRVVFQNRDRSAVVSLINLSNTVNTYRMDWVMYKMDAQGRYDSVPIATGPNSVEKMVIFSPRQVTIRPEQHQLVRLSLRRPADLPPGEYRSHLQFTRLPKDGREGVTKEDLDPAKKPKGARMQVNAAISFSVPIIVRSGEDDGLKVALKNPRFENVTDNNGLVSKLKMDLVRESGKFSTYGTILVFWKKPGEKEERIVGFLNNVVIYPEIKQRPVEVALRGEAIRGGSLRVSYRGKYDSQGVIWDEQIIPIGN